MNCAGEEIYLSGTVHSTVHVTFNDAGVFTFTSHEILDNVVGYGKTTGTSYRAVGNMGATFTDGKTSTFTYITNAVLVGSGPGNNALAMTVWHDVILDDWTNPVTVDRAVLGCR